MNKFFKSGIIVFFISFVVFCGLFLLLLPNSKRAINQNENDNRKELNYQLVAVGDSLTQGVGDTTDQGGFVPLLAKRLNETYHYQTTTKNYGISGNTSQQILKRMRTQKAIKRDLKTANIMTLTVGGNDVLKVIREHFTDLDKSQFEIASKQYQKNLQKIIDLARIQQRNLPIYVVGIYNPFYLNFPEMTQMQDIVDNWNKKTKETLSHYHNVYFVDINDKLYKGIDGKEGVVSVSGDQKTITNDALFSEDHFHPNNTGYTIICTAIMNRILKTHEK